MPVLPGLIDRLLPDARLCLSAAYGSAGARGSAEVTVTDLLVGLLTNCADDVRYLLSRQGVEPTTAVDQLLGRLALTGRSSIGAALGSSAESVLAASDSAALRRLAPVQPVDLLAAVLDRSEELDVPLNALGIDSAVLRRHLRLVGHGS